MRDIYIFCGAEPPRPGTAD